MKLLKRKIKNKMEDNLKLCFVKKLGENSEGNYIYEFLFTNNIDEFWGADFQYKPLALVNNVTPNEGSYNLIKQIETELEIDVVQDSLCFSFQDCIDQIVALAFENLDGADEYPEDGRLVFHFGDDFEKVEELLSKRDIIFIDNNHENEEVF